MRGEDTLTDVVLLYIDWDLGGEYMSEAKKNGPKPFFTFYVYSASNPITMRVNNVR